MKFWFDTEFFENGQTINLISIGVVSEDGREYYAETDFAAEKCSTDWLKANVRPHLSRGGEAEKSRGTIKRDLIEFMGASPEIWAYYADYDWVVLCQLFGTMMDLPKGWPMYCRDVKQFADSLGNPTLPPQGQLEHNAIADARWTERAWRVLQKPDLMPIYGATEDPSAAELAVGQIVTVITVTDDGVETERVPWSEIMNPSGGNIDDLGRAQRAAKGHSNVARHNAAVAETAIAEVDRLRAALETIAGLPDVRCDEASTVARNALNDGTRPGPGPGPFPTEPDSGPGVLGEQKGD